MDGILQFENLHDLYEVGISSELAYIRNGYETNQITQEKLKKLLVLHW